MNGVLTQGQEIYGVVERREELQGVLNAEQNLDGTVNTATEQLQGSIEVSQTLQGEVIEVAPTTSADRTHTTEDIEDFETFVESLAETYAKKDEIPTVPTKVSELENDKGYLTEHQSLDGYAKKDEIPSVPTKVSAFENDKGYLTEHQSLEGYAKKEEMPVVPTKVSAFENDKGYLTEHQSLEGYAKKEEIPSIPEKVSAFENDKGYLTDETDPTVPSWAKTEKKPVYTSEEVGADAQGTASNLVSAHNTDTEVHSDIRLLIKTLTDRLDAVANSSDKELDQLSEIVEYIKNNKSLIDSITTSKVNVVDIVDNLTTNVSNKPLSASQGVVLKALIDAITVPTKVSQLENDEGYLKQHQDLSAYAKKTEIPTVPTKVSAFENDKGYLTQHQDLSSYAKKSEIPTVPTKVSQLENDKGYLTTHQDLSAYAKKSDIPSVAGFLTEADVRTLIESIVLNGYLGGYRVRVANDGGQTGYITVKKG